ncbi:OmpA family protein [Allosalinactinospora lopnorensis]|uniref:OmpA family protein n=1 Tax=Allosalinactinospora lopnorensis TaxID=1352348 RepID=UPI000AF39A69|nr:OmpA family protein [Allosalinactinospora lopnorensis]
MEPRSCIPLLSLVVSGSLLLGGCGLAGDDTPGEGGDAAEDGREERGSGFVQEGYVGSYGDFLHARVEVTEVARLDDRTRTTIEFTNLQDDTVKYAQSKNVLKPAWFNLLDPVNQRRYNVYTDIGTKPPASNDWSPGVAYEIVVYSPPLEDNVDQVTVQAPGGIGEFTGVPVVEGEPETYPSEAPEESPSEGDTVTYPVDDGDPEPLDDDYEELYGVVENVVQGRETEDDTETVALRADVLFEFDEADLTDNAESVLEEVVEETRERADPENPPITIAGHTDGVGDDDYNRELSEERAESVRELLEGELGGEYEYETEGHGSSDPVEREGGDDDTWARAQNRRVEISYAFLDDVANEDAGDEEYEEELLEVDPSEAGEPAAFRAHRDEEPVAQGEFTQEREDGDREWTMRVYPFYRDGAYLVVRFDITLDHGPDLRYTQNPFGSGNTGRVNFGVIDPASGTIHQQVRRRDPDRTVHRLGWKVWPPATGKGVTQYGYMYVPAPPEDVTSVTFDGADFGRFPGVPIEE